jgi:hypothetical protein
MYVFIMHIPIGYEEGELIVLLHKALHGGVRIEEKIKRRPGYFSCWT